MNTPATRRFQFLPFRCRVKSRSLAPAAEETTRVGRRTSPQPVTQPQLPSPPRPSIRAIRQPKRPAYCARNPSLTNRLREVSHISPIRPFSKKQFPRPSTVDSPAERGHRGHVPFTSPKRVQPQYVAQAHGPLCPRSAASRSHSPDRSNAPMPNEMSACGEPFPTYLNAGLASPGGFGRPTLASRQPTSPLRKERLLVETHRTRSPAVTPFSSPSQSLLQTFLTQRVEHLSPPTTGKGHVLRRRLLLFLNESVQQPHDVVTHTKQDASNAVRQRDSHFPESVTQTATDRQSNRPAKLNRLDRRPDPQPVAA